MRTISVFLAAALMATVAGCGSDARAPVKGTVTFGGKGPLAGGTIFFISVADSKRIGSGMIDPDGTYEVHDAPVGACKVIFDNSHLDPTGRKGMMGAPGGTGAGAMAGMKGAPKVAAPGGSGGPSAKDKDKMVGAPKGADIPAEMSANQVDYSKLKYVKLDPKHPKFDSTPHSFTVASGPNSTNFNLD